MSNASSGGKTREFIRGGSASGSLASRLLGWGAGGRRTQRPSGKLKDLLEQTVGTAYDRNPCPHKVVRWDTIRDVQRPSDVHRDRTRRTLVACERPAGHEHSQSEIERAHSGIGSVW